MNDIHEILSCLRTTPLLLQNFIAQIPQEERKIRRIAGKWSIHEHACHLVDVQPMLSERFRLCLREERPEITPYIPGTTDADDYLLDLNLEAMLAKFPAYREELLHIVKDQDQTFWNKTIIHPEYRLYTPYILLRHILFHDHFHLYRIEAMWLTTDDYL